MGYASDPHFIRQFPDNCARFLDVKRVRVGSIEVKIYPAPGDRAVAAFYDFSGKRIRLERESNGQAEKAAREKIAEMTSGEALERTRAEDLLRPYGVSVLDAARFYIDHHKKSQRPTIRVLDLVDQLIASKETSAGAWHRRDLERRLRRGFGETFGEKLIHQIDTPTINKWIASLEVSGRTQRNALVAVIQLFRFARARGYLPEGPTAAEKAEKPRAEAPKKEVFSPEEMRKLIAHVSPEALPCLLLGGFAGLRSEEMCPFDPEDAGLEWEDILWDDQQIYIRDEVAKTEARYVPLLPNLAAWLLPHRKAKGRVCKIRRLDLAFAKAAEASGVRWRHNGLRHSFGTYRTAATKSVPQVSLEMGNSIQMVKRHYQRPVPTKLAEAWFAIQPTKTRVIPISSAG